MINQCITAIKKLIEIECMLCKTEAEHRRRNLVNYVAVISLFNIITYATLFSILDFTRFKWILIFHLFNLVVFISCIILNKNGHFKLARLTINIYLPFTIAIVAAVIFGKDLEFHVFLLLTLLIPLLVWSWKDHLITLLFIVYNLGLFAFIEFSKLNMTPLIEVPSAYFQLFRNANIIICFVGAAFAFAVYQHFVNKTEKELIERSAELEATQKVKDNLYSIIAHDLRGPLSSIYSLTEIVIQETKQVNDDSLHAITKALNNAAKSTHMLMENLLAWSKFVQNKKLELNETVDLNTSVHDTMNLFQFLIQQKKQHIEVAIDSRLSVIHNNNAIKTIFRNLISNAIKFTPENGSIKITAIGKNAQVKVCVSDSGVGISKDKLQNLFLNEKIESSPGTNNEPGSGLGLKLCKDFVEKAGGSIWVESTPDKGSRFYFTLPRK